MPLVYHFYKLLLIGAYSFLVYTCYHDGSLGSYYGDLILWLLLVPTVFIWIASFMQTQRVRLYTHAVHGMVLVGMIVLLFVVMLYTREPINSLTFSAISPTLPIIVEAIISIDYLRHSAFHQQRRL